MSSAPPNFDTQFEEPSKPAPPGLPFLAPARAPGEIGWLAHYRVLKVLGQGGMGIVLLAEDSQLQRRVALKIIRPDIGQSLTNRQRFLREARAMAQVRSDHVVTVHQVGQVDDVCYLAMEFLEGESLDNWLERSPSPPVDEALRIAREITQALAAAHAQGLVHRDVKPANVWLEGPARRVKLLDFGLARPLAADVDITNPGMIVGTPSYMAPEQARGETIDGRADMFSLGCVLYEMIAGRLPFEGETAVAVLSAVLSVTPPRPEQFRPGIPKALSEFVMRLLAKLPSARPASAEAVGAELRAIERAQSAIDAKPTILGQEISQGDLHWSGVQARGISTFAETPPSTSASMGGSEFGARDTPQVRHRSREAERRQVTVLVSGTDLFESEDYLGLDAEDQVKVLRAFQATCEGVVQRFEGTLVQCDERGLLACFGFPVAYEDAARRAAQAARAMLAELTMLAEGFRTEHGLELSSWAGLHTGPAVVAAKEGAVTLAGEARNVAIRIEDFATPGQVVCTEATHKLIRKYFQCTSLGAQKIKGFAQPIAMYRVEVRVQFGSLIEASAPAELSPLTGRDLEVRLLKDRWEQAAEGMGQVVLLVGEPGLGKSRLVHTLKQHVLGQMAEGEMDAPVIEWRCAPHFQNTGLYPAIDFYERALGFGHDESPQVRFERLLKRLEQYDLASPDVVALWASLMSLPTPDRFPPLALPPARLKEETFRALSDWLHVRAARKPVVLVVEDLHWADASTLELLGLLFDEIANDRVLTLLTFRPEFQPPWSASSHQTTLSLSRLNKRQATELMRQKARPGTPDSLFDKIFERTGGVPLFVEEFTKMVQESAALGGADGGTSTDILAAREIPATIQDLMTARLDRMGGERELAQLAAVLGREFGHELMAAVATLDEPTLQAELAALQRAEIVYAKGRPPRCTYTFKHALLEDSLYNSLVKTKRQQLHGRVGDVLAAQFPQTVDTRPELLAHHYTEAGQNEKAIDYWLKAGLRSRARSADHEAIGHLTKGLALLETQAQSPERDDREVQFLTALAPAYIAARGYAAPEVGTLLMRARELSRGKGDTQQFFGITLGLWEWRIVRGDLRMCVDLAVEGMALAESVNDPGMMMEALFMPGVTAFYRGQFAEARPCLEKALANYDDRERTKFWTAYTGHNAGVTHRCYLALTLWQLGFPDRALQTGREMLELARSIGHAFTLGHAIDFAAVLYHNCRLGVELQAMGEEERVLATEQGFPLWQALGLLHKGAGIYLQGRGEEAMPLLLKGYAAFRATGAGIRVPRYLGMLVEAQMRIGEFEKAHTALGEAGASAERNDERTHAAELQRLKGELLLAESPDQAAAAEESFRRAIAIARQQQSKGWELRATMSLTMLLRKQGRRDEARDILAAVYGTYTEGLGTPDLVEAAGLLESLA